MEGNLKRLIGTFFKVPFISIGKVHEAECIFKVAQSFKSFKVHIKYSQLNLELTYCIIPLDSMKQRLPHINKCFSNYKFTENSGLVYVTLNIKCEPQMLYEKFLLLVKECEKRIAYIYPALALDCGDNFSDICSKVSGIRPIEYPVSTVFELANKELYEQEKSFLVRAAECTYAKIAFSLFGLSFDDNNLTISFTEPVDAFSIEIQLYANEVNNNDLKSFIENLSKENFSFDIKRLSHCLSHAKSLGIYLSPKKMYMNNYFYSQNIHESSFYIQELQLIGGLEALLRPLEAILPVADLIHLNDQNQLPGLNFLSLHIPKDRIYYEIELFKKFKTLRHCGFVKILGIYLDNGSNEFYIVFEHPGTRLLKNEIATSQVTRKKKIKWMLQIAEAVRFSMLRGFYNLQISLDNIYIDEFNNAKICPYLIEIKNKFLSPEELLGFVSPKSEMYRLGLVLYNIFYAQDDYDSSSEMHSEIELLSELANRKEYYSLNEEFESANSQISLIIHELLHFDWSFRLSAEELCEMLKGFKN